MISNTSISLSFSIQLFLPTLPDFKAPITICCSPGFLPKKVGPISNSEMSSYPRSWFFFKWIARLENIDLLKTFRSLDIGFKIGISFSPFENCLSILESVKDQVTVSKYPFEARDLWDRWNNFCLKFRVSLSLILSGVINLIFLKPLILISSSIMSTSWLISGLHEGISILRSFFSLFANET